MLAAPAQRLLLWPSPSVPPVQIPANGRSKWLKCPVLQLWGELGRERQILVGASIGPVSFSFGQFESYWIEQQAVKCFYLFPFRNSYLNMKLKNGPFTDSFFVWFRLLNSKYDYYKILPRTGFEPQSSEIGSDHSANLATITVRKRQVL